MQMIYKHDECFYLLRNSLDDVFYPIMDQRKSIVQSRVTALDHSNFLVTTSTEIFMYNTPVWLNWIIEA